MQRRWKSDLSGANPLVSQKKKSLPFPSTKFSNTRVKITKYELTQKYYTKEYSGQGASNKKEELSNLISRVKPHILCIYEALLRKLSSFNLKHYNGLFTEMHVNYRAREGIAILINEANYHKKYFCIYNSRLHEIKDLLSTDLFLQLPDPVILTGDFNSYNEI